MPTYSTRVPGTTLDTESTSTVELPQYSPTTGIEVLDAIRREIDGYYATLRTLNGLHPVDVFMQLSGISARASELRNWVIDFDHRPSLALRTKHIDPLIEEVDRQFKFHSRIQAVREVEAKLSGGAP